MGELNIIVWSRIDMGFKLEPVIFQNIGQCRGNGVMGALCIHQVLDACNSTSVHHAFVSAICDGIAIYEKNDIRPLLVTPVLTLHSSPCVMNASTVACIMERYSWGEQNIIVWSGIGISFKLGPVIFQNIGQCRGNGVMGALCIHQVLRLEFIKSLNITTQMFNQV
jgi:hypothetical protein